MVLQDHPPPPSPPTSQLSLTHSLSTTPFHPYPWTPPPTSHLPCPIYPSTPFTTPHHPSPLPQGTRNQIGSYRTGANKISHRWGEQTKKEYTNHTHVSARHCKESVTNLNQEEVMVVSLSLCVMDTETGQDVTVNFSNLNVPCQMCWCAAV